MMNNQHSIDLLSLAFNVVELIMLTAIYLKVSTLPSGAGVIW